MKYTKEGERRHREARAKQVREKHPMWKGKILRGGYWYLFMPEHPKSGKQGYVAEHRVVVEGAIGRHLTAEECVHHKDGNKQNNSLENLELFSSHGQHTLHHPEVLHILRTINIGKRRSVATEFKKGMKPWCTGMIISNPDVVCSVAGCDRSAWYKNGGKGGLCSMHHQRKRRGVIF